MATFQRARSDDAKLSRETAILDAARQLGLRHGIRSVTLTDIAERIGMHKSALLRYFETREQIFLRLTAQEWASWGPALVTDLATAHDAHQMGVVIAHSLANRPLFCDLLAHAPMNLERNVSPESVRAFKLVTLGQVDAIGTAIRTARPGLSDRDTVDIIAAATSIAGAMWQMATPGEALADVYRSDPRLTHAIVDLEPTLARILSALIAGIPNKPSPYGRGA
jgi:AcrR family transcriptional regulator